MQVIMFGAGTTGRILYSEIASKDEVIAFADNNHERWGELLFDIPICNPEECLVNRHMMQLLFQHLEDLTRFISNA